jgi:uncharacterized protein with NAD-binding domain and iron-sulfur cluster/predicted secreted hydrolase
VPADDRTSVLARSPRPQSDRGARNKVVILGGGPSALCCAWYLTSTRSLRDRYDVTVYTMGWKLGGKGSSGRGAHGRIEEHGLHVLFGSYHSFFRTIRECYDELARPATHPMPTWRDAFKPHDFGVVEDRFHGAWHAWKMTFPRNDAVPGDRGTALSSSDYFSMVVQSLFELVFGWRALARVHERAARAGGGFRVGDGPDLPVRAALGVLKELLAASHTFARAADKLGVSRILAAARALLWPALHGLASHNERSHRFWLGFDFVTAFLRGIIADGVLEEDGFARIDHLDFREWLTRHGVHHATLESPWVRTIYDSAFAYAGGDPATQRIAAGVAAHLLLGFGMYRESMYFKMQAGMGDTVFAPLYLALRQRGVAFEFFHKVESLHLDARRKRIQRVRLTRQARVASEGAEYDPLIHVNGLECWPAEPRYEQLADGDALRGVDLESYYEASPHAAPVTLEAQRDFDTLVFGIPIGAVPLLCGELVDHHPRWREMVEHVTSVQTVSFQTWMKKDLEALGWEDPSPLLSLYVEPLNTWADMSQVIGAEAWPKHLEPRNVSYFTGPQPGPRYAPDPAREPDFERRQTARAKALALDYLRHSLTDLLPGARSSRSSPAIDWNLLIDPLNRKGEARFEAQYWRSNCGPSERCTLADPGSIRYRMQAGETGFRNLVVTGDWIDNGLYAACMEGAFNSGILAARAISGCDFEIDGLGYSVTNDPLHPKHDKRPAGQPIRPSEPVLLPRDDGVIDDVLVQWWYWTGQLSTSSGREFGVEIVFFVAEAFHDFLDATMGQAAVSDLAEGRFVNRQIEGPGRPERADGRFDLDLGDIRATGGGGRDRLFSTMHGYEVDLEVLERSPPLIHYDGCDHVYAFGGDTRYYSRPLMHAAGTITTPDGEIHQVEGDLWFDRQWGELLPAVHNGWQWFAVQLDGGVQIMLYAFRDSREEWTGSVSRADGTVAPLASHQFDVEVLDWWVSPRTGHRYPHGWRVTVPGEELFIRPKLADQEMAAGFWIGPEYWEGACSVDGTSSGRAYVELTGFRA